MLVPKSDAQDVLGLEPATGPPARLLLMAAHHGTSPAATLEEQRLRQYLTKHEKEELLSLAQSVAVQRWKGTGRQLVQSGGNLPIAKPLPNVYHLVMSQYLASRKQQTFHIRQDCLL